MEWVEFENGFEVDCSFLPIRIPVKSWCKDPEKGAEKQIFNLANLPFAFHHIAVMPDCHEGYGMPIGGVLATEGVIIPDAVGVDIGCGMQAVKTNLTDITMERLKEIMILIRQRIPVGFNHHSKNQDESLMPNVLKNVGGNGEPCKYDFPIAFREYNSALKQLGTLGSGNHFCEIQKGSDGFIWIMVHSGSRNIGYKVAEYYNKLAVELNEKWYTQVPKEWDLAFLPLDSEEGQSYIREMEYCLEFAKQNRNLMIERIKESFIDVPCNFCNGKGGRDGSKCIPCNGTGLLNNKISVNFEKPIDIHHNYAIMENHFGKNVMVHRKGATLAREGTIGIIPGSQGTSSYIVKGKGNKESFDSCSHGAGRSMSRSRAKKDLDLITEQKKLNDKGILHAIRDVSDLDEASGSYKDIDEVMKSQEDLVEILVKLEPLAVIKG